MEDFLTTITPNEFSQLVRTIHSDGAAQAVVDYPETSPYARAMFDLGRAEQECKRLEQEMYDASDRVQRLEADLRQLMGVEE
jgi:hypothetical protein